MVEVNTFVRVAATVQAGGLPRLRFGRGLLVTADDAISAGGDGKATLFESLAAVTDVFGGSGDVYDAAAVWFAADPPPQGLYVGRWANVDVSTSLAGEPTVAAGAAPLDSSTAAFAVNGTQFAVDLSSASSYAAVAAALQADIDGESGFSGTTVIYAAGSGFTVTFPDARALQPGGFAAPDSGTDISAALGLDPASASYIRGHDAEAVGAAVDEMIDLAPGGAPTVVVLSSDVPASQADGDDSIDTRLALSAHAEASQFVFMLSETSDAALLPTDTDSHAARAYAAQRGQTQCVFGAAGEKPDVGVAAAMSAQNFDLPASVITPQGIALPGVLPRELTVAELDALTAKRCSAYTRVGGQPAFVGGYTSRDGYWLDAVVFLQWLRSAVESAVWGGIRSARRYSRADLYDSLSGVMERAVRAGGLQPGRSVSAATRADIRAATGNQAFDGTLGAGYAIWVDPRPSQTDLEQRIARFKIWAAGSPAVHEVAGDIIFTN